LKDLRYKCFGCGTPFTGSKDTVMELIRMHKESGPPHDQIRVDES